MEDPKVLKKLKPRYMKAYGLLCKEHGQDISHVAREILSAVKGGIQKYGDEPIQLIEQISTQLSQLPEEPLLKQMIDWGAESMKIEELAQQADGNVRAIGFVKEAGKQLLHKIQYGETSHDNLYAKHMEGYMIKVYSADFEAKIRVDHSTESRGIVLSNLENVRGSVFDGLSKFSQNALKNKSVASLRMPPQKKPDVGLSIDIDSL